MNEEIQSDNKDTQVDNKTPETPEANLPTPPGQEVETEQPKEPQDPEYAKWAKETGSLENAYKRLQGSAEEATKWRTEAEELKQTKAQYDQLTQEILWLKENKPELVEQMQQAFTPEGESEETDNKVELPEEDRKLLDNIRAKERYEANQTINQFRDSFKDYIKDDKQWDVIRDHAKRLDGHTDINGNPYTLKTALQAALRAEIPQVVSDKAALETYASNANRDSAAEPGDTSSASSSEPGLTAEEEAFIQRFSKWGATREGQLQRKTRNSDK